MEVLQQTEEQNQPGVTPDVPAEGAPEANPETTGTPETPVAPEEPVAPEAPAEGDGNPPSEEGGEV